MSTYTFYIHTISGDIATLSDWRSDYDAMDVESWHGKPAEECDPNDWIADGKLEAIELTSADNCQLTDMLFPGCFNDAEEGESYLSEWADSAVDDEGNEYQITWRFPVVKGEEPEDDSNWPWEDEAFIHRVESI